MQATAIFSFLLAVITMTLIYVELTFWANLIFSISLFALMVSLVLSRISFAGSCWSMREGSQGTTVGMTMIFQTDRKVLVAFLKSEILA